MPNGIAFPDQLRTERLVLARWRVAHAATLGRALEANVDHLRAWIPWRIAEPATLPALEQRLAGFEADFDNAREWVYALFLPDESDVLGAFGLYPRDATGRVPSAAADRLELGYWLRADVVGHGYATEAGAALIDLVRAHGTFTQLEIRCDQRNARSAAVPVRLCFRHAETVGEPGSDATMIWRRDLAAD